MRNKPSANSSNQEKHAVALNFRCGEFLHSLSQEQASVAWFEVNLSTPFAAATFG